MNTQAFRNHMFTRGNQADAAMELYFRNTKGTKEESADLKKGSIHDSLSHLFTFQTIRVTQVARELASLLRKHKFMDCDPPKEDIWVKSTLYRWIDQVTVVYTLYALCACASKLSLQIALIPNCTLQRTVGDYYVVLETVNKRGVSKRLCTQHHIAPSTHTECFETASKYLSAVLGALLVNLVRQLDTILCCKDPRMSS
jgi:hypothetical protein